MVDDMTLKGHRILRGSRKSFPAMMTLEAAYIVPVFFLIIFGSIGVAADMYMDVKTAAENIQDNEKIDAVKNFRYAAVGEGLLSVTGGKD